MENTGQFPKGHAPKCPIRPGQHIGKATEFKRGNKPANKLVVGCIRIRQDRNDSKRAWIKIAEPNMWILRAMYVWQSAHGRVLDKFVLHHIDKNSLNDDLDNLCVLTRAAHKHIHRQDLQAGKVNGYKPRDYVDNRIPIKAITCSSCSDTYKAKYQRKDALCDICLRERRRQRVRDNSKRLRATNKNRKSTPA